MPRTIAPTAVYIAIVKAVSLEPNKDTYIGTIAAMIANMLAIVITLAPRSGR